MSHEVRNETDDITGSGSGPETIVSKSSNSDRESDRGGGFADGASAAVADADVLAAIWAGDGIASASAVASALDITRETARAHLRALQTAGTLERTSDGPGSVWRLPDRDE